MTNILKYFALEIQLNEMATAAVGIKWNFIKVELLYKVNIIIKTNRINDYQ